jgi:hypothetical protein
MADKKLKKKSKIKNHSLDNSDDQQFNDKDLTEMRKSMDASRLEKRDELSPKSKKAKLRIKCKSDYSPSNLREDIWLKVCRYYILTGLSMVYLINAL